MDYIKRKFILIIFFSFLLGISCQKEQTQYDIAILGGRVIDPETQTDKIMNVGIIGDSIVAISSEKLEGKTIINASGMVVAPGFIDLHAHGQTNIENINQAFDGVTTALELEVGVDTLSQWFQNRQNKALLNYGASACQLAIRNKVISGIEAPKKSIYDELIDSAAYHAVPQNKYQKVRKKFDSAISTGAIGIGIPVGYVPGASVEEIFDIYQYAGQKKVPVFTHLREGGAIAFQQVINDAVLNNTTLHICHINSMARKDIAFCLKLVETAQKKGFPITTEMYPYTAGNTEIGSAIFDEGWQKRLSCSYSDLQWAETGERLTAETFKKYRKKGGSVTVHMMKPEWIEMALKSTVTMIASDGGDCSAHSHPRGSGTFSKILGEYVREKKILSLAEAIKKMTLMPAQLLEKVIPEMKKRGRIQVGCKSDLVIFDPKKIIDKATYENGCVKSTGVKYLLINGKVLIKNGVLIPNQFPGKAVKSKQLTQK